MLCSKTTTHAVAAGLAAAFLAVFLVIPAPAGEIAAPCADAPVLAAGDAERGEGLEPGRSDRFLLRIAEPGLAAVGAVAPGRQALAPEVELDSTPCAATSPGPPAVVQRQANGTLLVLARTPGAYRLRVRPRDPLLALGAYRLESRFAAVAAASPPEVAPDVVHAADGTGEEEEEEIEEVEGEPINLWTPPWRSGGSVGHLAAADGTGGGSGGEEEEEIEEVEGEPINLWTPEPGVIVIAGDESGASPRMRSVSAGRMSLRLRAGEETSRLRFFPLCRSAVGDDHHDLPLCASALELGGEAVGSLANTCGDDHDQFTFRLDAPTRVEVESAGSSDTFGGLYDARGRRLAVDDDGGVGRNFRLRAALGPGRYFVRVEGAEGAEGGYRIVLHATAP